MGAGIPEVNAVPKTGQDADFETISVTVDSGAYNTVGPPHIGTYFKIANTEASKSGRHYRAANGTPIKNYGQRVVRGTNEAGTPVSLPIQVADVNKVLGSVREMVKAGNKVVFDEDANGKPCSYVEYKKTGMRTVIHDNNGNFQFAIRVPKGETAVNKVEEDRKSEEDNRGEGFPRQGVLRADLFY